MSHMSIIARKIFFGAAVLGATLMIMGAAYIPKNSSHFPAVRAAAGTLTGYAWSENIGWISFSGTASDSSPYAVTVNNDNTLSGYAWSDNVGWINFGPNSCGATPTLSGGALTGWAHVVIAGSGWDGCIKLADAAAPAYGPTLSGSDFGGFSWGSDNMGWISYNCNTGATNNPTTTYLTSGSSWVVPSDWNSSNNSIRVIGGGGGGSNRTGSAGGRGGGGGAYSAASNVALTPGTTVTYAVGAGGLRGATGGTGGDTYLCNSTSNCASIAGTAVRVGAKGGGGGVTGGSGGAGGSAASGVGTIKFSGGAGPTVAGSSGGGAAGPNGAGANGNGSSSFYPGGGGGGNGGGAVGGVPTENTGGRGGNNSSASGGGAGGTAAATTGAAGTAGGGGGGGGAGSSSSGPAGAGGAGIEFDATHGSGGGGGGGAGSDEGAGGAGGNGGLYGGGGGSGGAGSSGGLGGNGAQGVIVITYVTTTQSICPTSDYKVSYSGPITTPACTLSVSPNPAGNGSSISLNYTTTGTPTLGTIRDASNNVITTTATSTSGTVSATAPSSSGTYVYTLTVSNPLGSTICQTSPGLTTQLDVCTDISGLQSSLPSGCTGPSPSPSGVCTPAGYAWNGTSCAASSPANLTLSGTRVRKGNPTVLSYTMTNPSGTCAITGTNGYSSGSFAAASSGSVTTIGYPLVASTDFTLVCGTASKTATVNVIPLVEEQ